MAGPAARALQVLQAGGLVAFPTETVWGLAARAESASGVERLRAWKGRSCDRPVSLMVSGPDVLPRYEFELSDAAHALMAAFWPGALTLVLPCRRRFAVGIAREDGAVGVRCSTHPAAVALVRDAEAVGAGPLTATSLNQSGDPPARTRAEAAKLCGEGAEAGEVPDRAAPLLLESVLDAGGEPPSTVVDLTGQLPTVLRAGGLELDPVSWLALRGVTAKGEAQRG